MIAYRSDAQLTPEAIAAVFDASGIKRPTTDLPRLEAMFANADLIISAWDGKKLIGLCRALTDFSYCCYLSDLAVEKAYQHQGIGKSMIEQVKTHIGDAVSLILLSAPEAMQYYPKIGFDLIANGFIIKRLR